MKTRRRSKNNVYSGAKLTHTQRLEPWPFRPLLVNEDSDVSSIDENKEREPTTFAATLLRLRPGLWACGTIRERWTQSACRRGGQLTLRQDLRVPPDHRGKFCLICRGTRLYLTLSHLRLEIGKQSPRVMRM